MVKAKTTAPAKKRPPSTKPFPMKARFPGRCKDCPVLIAVGDEIMYFPAEKKAQCKNCSTPQVSDEEIADLVAYSIAETQERYNIISPPAYRGPRETWPK